MMMLKKMMLKVIKFCERAAAFVQANVKRDETPRDLAPLHSIS
jgi:hypothetical protein